MATPVADGYQAVDVPYSRGEMSMTVLLPGEGTFGEFEDSLDADSAGPDPW